MPASSVIQRVLSIKRYALTCVGAGVGFGFTYMIITGMLMLFPQELEGEMKVPLFLIYDSIFQLYQGSPASLVWIVPKTGMTWAPTKHFAFLIELPGAVFVFIASLLVGIIAALIYYSLRVPRCSCRKEAVLGLSGAIFACFSTFGCCAGGLLMLIIGATAFFTISFYYSKLFMSLSILLLVLGVRSLANRLSDNPRN